MMLCALVFLPWFLPRETVCGLAGRWAATEGGWKRGLGRRLAWAFDRTIHGAEPCGQVYEMERAARVALYVRGELAGLE
jgi:hypothetical protein